MASWDEAFVEFVRVRSPRLVTLARLVGDPSHAEDAVQAVLLRLYHRWPRLGDDPYGYARHSVVNAVIDQHRRRGGSSRSRSSLTRPRRTTSSCGSIGRRCGRPWPRCRRPNGR